MGGQGVRATARPPHVEAPASRRPHTWSPLLASQFYDSLLALQNTSADEGDGEEDQSEGEESDEDAESDDNEDEDSGGDDDDDVE